MARDHERVSQVAKFKERAAEAIEISTPAELKELLGVAKPELVTFRTIGAFAGLRRLSG